MSKRIGTVFFILFNQFFRCIIWHLKFETELIMRNAIFDQQELLCIHYYVDILHLKELIQNILLIKLKMENLLFLVF